MSVVLVARTFEDAARFRISGPTDLTKSFKDGAFAWECCPDITDKEAIAACEDLRPGATVKLKPGRYKVDVGEYDGERMAVSFSIAANRRDYRVCVLGVDHEFGEVRRVVVYGRPDAFEVKTFLPGCLDLCP